MVPFWCTTRKECAIGTVLHPRFCATESESLSAHAAKLLGSTAKLSWTKVSDSCFSNKSVSFPLPIMKQENRAWLMRA
eukprot:s5303_g1.t1